MKNRFKKVDARLPKVMIPLIRRTFPSLIASQLVGVQPMSGPVGLSFAMNHRYGSFTKNRFKKNRYRPAR